MRFLALYVGLLLSLPSFVFAADCKDVEFRNNSYTVCTANNATEKLELFLYDNDEEPIGHFSSLNRALRKKGLELAFAMNAGMYHEDRSPVGHYIENGKELRGIMTKAGPGNFGLLPNGVFCIRQNRADVFETKLYKRKKPNCRHATQSGPMLVINGKLHPRFLVDSTSNYIRNGVGTSADGMTSHFVISNNTVTFHEFGTFFRDFLQTPQALYFDGNISRLYAPDLSRSDFGFSSLGPIVGVVKDK